MVGTGGSLRLVTTPTWKAPLMLALLTICLVLGVVAGLVLLFVAYPYRGRALPVAEPLGDAVAAVADKIDPGEAPPQGVLSSAEGARRTRRRIEKAESRLTARLRDLTGTVTGSAPSTGAPGTNLADQPAPAAGTELPRRSAEEVDLRQQSLDAGPRHSRR